MKKLLISLTFLAGSAASAGAQQPDTVANQYGRFLVEKISKARYQQARQDQAKDTAAYHFGKMVQKTAEAMEAKFLKSDVQVERTGNVLKISSFKRNVVEFADVPVQAEQRTSYFYAGYQKQIHSYMVLHFGWESVDIVLVNDSSGNRTEVPADFIINKKLRRLAGWDYNPADNSGLLESFSYDWKGEMKSEVRIDRSQEKYTFGQAFTGNDGLTYFKSRKNKYLPKEGYYKVTKIL